MIGRNCRRGLPGVNEGSSPGVPKSPVGKLGQKSRFPLPDRSMPMANRFRDWRRRRRGFASLAVDRKNLSPLLITTGNIPPNPPNNESVTQRLSPEMATPPI